MKIKSIFHHFKGLSAARNFLRPESGPLSEVKRWILPSYWHFLQNAIITRNMKLISSLLYMTNILNFQENF